VGDPSRERGGTKEAKATAIVEAKMTPHHVDPVFEAALEMARARAFVLADLRGALVRGDDALALELARHLAGLDPAQARVPRKVKAAK
jgi:hypothetical protein